MELAGNFLPFRQPLSSRLPHVIHVYVTCDTI